MYVKSPLQRDEAAVVTLSVIVTDVSAKRPQSGKGFNTLWLFSILLASFNL